MSGSPAFSFGIDYSGAQTPTASLKALRVYLAEGDAPPAEVLPPPSARTYWMRRGIAEWLVGQLAAAPPPWSASITAFRSRYTTSKCTDSCATGRASLTISGAIGRPTTITPFDFVREGRLGMGAARMGDARWPRLTEKRAGGAKSVFHFDVQGSVAKSTHAGLPWLRFLRSRLGARVHYWPFDGWQTPKDDRPLPRSIPLCGAAASQPKGARRISTTPSALPPGLHATTAPERSLASSRPTSCPASARWRRSRVGYWASLARQLVDTALSRFEGAALHDLERNEVSRIALEAGEQPAAARVGTRRKVQGQVRRLKANSTRELVVA